MSADPMERRVGNRININGRFKGLLPDKKIIEGLIKNLSSGGVYLESPENIAKNVKLLLELKLPIKGKLESFHARGMVVHVTLLSDNAGFGIGIKWLEIDEKGKKILNQLV